MINVAIDMNKRSYKTEELKEDSNIIHPIYGVSVEERLDLYSAVDLLKEKYKTVIIMKYFNDMKIKEISEITNIPENTVKTYLNRAKESLKQILKEDYLDE